MKSLFAPLVTCFCLCLLASERTYHERTYSDREYGGRSYVTNAILSRGAVAMWNSNSNGTYVTWRKLYEDGDDTTYSLYRGETKIVTNTTATAYWDDHDGVTNYTVEASSPTHAVESQTVTSINTTNNGITLTLGSTNWADSVVFADVDGDRELDAIIRSPYTSQDPETYVEDNVRFIIEAYNLDSTKLWTHTIGTSVPHLSWAAPYIAYDVQGKGYADVFLHDGWTTNGGDYLTVLDGKNGGVRTNLVWPSQLYLTNSLGVPWADYTNRNMLTVGYLDGYQQNPSIIAVRGCYRNVRIKAWNSDYSTRFDVIHTGTSGGYDVGHGLMCADLDNDGREEICIGGCVYRGDGTLLWAQWRYHPDAMYIVPIASPFNLAVQLSYEVLGSGGIRMVRGVNGSVLWSITAAQDHYQGQGMAARVVTNYPGLQFYGLPEKRGYINPATGSEWTFSEQAVYQTNHSYLLTMNGTVITNGVLGKWYASSGGQFEVFPIYWHSLDYQRFIAPRVGRHRYDMFDATMPYDFADSSHVSTMNFPAGTEGPLVRVQYVSDVMGDAHEEIIAFIDNMIFIYFSPFTDGVAVCRLQDELYQRYHLSKGSGYSFNNVSSSGPGRNTVGRVARRR